MLILITGGIGSGKSTVAKHLAALGFCVLDCDKIYKEITSQPEYVAAVDSLTGCVRDGEIDRVALSKMMFSNPEVRAKIEGLAHPLVVERVMREIKGYEVAFVEVQVPAAFDGYAHACWTVTTASETAQDRVSKRDGRTREQIAGIMQAQSSAGYIERADELIVNDGSLQELYERVDELVAKYKLKP